MNYLNIVDVNVLLEVEGSAREDVPHDKSLCVCEFLGRLGVAQCCVEILDFLKEEEKTHDQVVEFAFFEVTVLQDVTELIALHPERNRLGNGEGDSTVVLTLLKLKL